jgi:acyl-CoA reductase-like NAD-dependent aldehyde dehydrogenase
MATTTESVRKILVGGEWYETGETLDVTSPFDGSVVGQVAYGGRADAERAVDAAARAMEQPVPAHERAAVLDRVAGLLRERREELARTISQEAGKPLATAQVEADRAVQTIIFSAHEARALGGELIGMDAHPAGVNHAGMVVRRPIGVVGAISPFNFPLNLVAHKLAPAIAAGCPVVLKPASQTPLSAVALALLLIDECGLPSDQLSVVTGGGGTVGNALVDHPDVAMITFTGSPDVGWSIRGRAPRKKVGLELGNNAPVIIEADADWKTAADKIKVAGYSHAGQSCISTQRVYVHRSIVSEVTDALGERVSSLVVGDPLSESTDVSALISTGERDRVSSWVAEAVATGAKVVTGGTIGDDGVLAPTLLADVTPDMKVCAREVFGPVVGIQAYDTLDEALALSNQTVYGLQAAIFTPNLATALKAARTLDFGGVLVNEVPTWRADQMPYGGVRDSGNTREGPRYAVREMTETRVVILAP